MVFRDPDNWLKVIEGKSRRELADFLLLDLVGYRNANRWRDDDLRHVENLLAAFGVPAEAPLVAMSCGASAGSG